MYHPLISSYPCIYSLLSILSLYQSCNLHPILVSTLYSPSCPCFKHLLPILSLYHPLISSYPCIYSLLSILSFYQSCSLHPIFVSILYSPSYPCPLLSIISFPFYLSQYPLLVLSHLEMYSVPCICICMFSLSEDQVCQVWIHQFIILCAFMLFIYQQEHRYISQGNVRTRA